MKQRRPPYENAVSHLKAAFPDGDFPSMKELKAEKARLTHLRNQKKTALRPLSDQRVQMRIITKNVEAILGMEVSTISREFYNNAPGH